MLLQSITLSSYLRGVQRKNHGFHSPNRQLLKILNNISETEVITVKTYSVAIKKISFMPFHI